MNSQLKRTIDQVKEVLMQDHDSIVYGQLHSGLGYTLPSDFPHLRQYYDFLGISNGARCGVIDLWSYEELKKNQYRMTSWVNDVSDWLEVGQILYEPLVINRKSGLLYVLKEEEYIKEEENIGECDDFLFNYVFGDKYYSIAEGVDDWWLLLKRLQYV
ncbi:hypothetical protein [Paenibacillus xylanexedens]|uniref:hypothetical protein n=1 Tax=Paenibacillus xylanexedens TaxID=528191 RepID=UPI0011A6B416|nr:hypothetical protein [Paenibacillus xylanexedens]